jgi:hypothetical protein
MLICIETDMFTCSARVRTPARQRTGCKRCHGALYQRPKLARPRDACSTAQATGRTNAVGDTGSSSCRCCAPRQIVESSITFFLTLHFYSSSMNYVHARGLSEASTCNQQGTSPLQRKFAVVVIGVTNTATRHCAQYDEQRFYLHVRISCTPRHAVT